MFEIFENAFRRDRSDPLPDIGPSPEPGQHLAARFSGCTFERGLYRVLQLTHVPKVKMLVDAGFPFLAGRVLPFSTDWLGRVFAADAGRLDGGEPMVLMLEPGTGEALEIPCTVQSFHDRELIEYRDAALAACFYEAWLDLGGSIPEATQCIGYRTPLFLGGTDDDQFSEPRAVTINTTGKTVDWYAEAAQLIRASVCRPPGCHCGGRRS